MGVIVGSNSSFVECDHFDGKKSCRRRTEPHVGPCHGQTGISQWTERQGWVINYDNGKTYCPEPR